MILVHGHDSFCVSLVPTQTDLQGQYVFDRVRPGRYSLGFMAIGFTVSPRARDSHIDPFTNGSDTFDVGKEPHIAGPWVGIVPLPDPPQC